MQTGLVCLELIARISGVDFDARAAVREFGLTESETTVEELVRIARKNGFRTKIKKNKIADLHGKYPFPVIAELKEGGFLSVLNMDAEKGQVLVFVPGEKNASALAITEFEEKATGRILVLKHREALDNVKFGFRWFYREILKYRRIIFEVLIGSFVIQLFGLVTPLFTQVILDKVIVHHSMSTLDVLGVAFLAVAGFEFLLNISRQYIFVHTVSKIDARLGAKLFKHLLQLPFVYFEHRRVGNIAARVRELDNIREFITNKSVSVLIDLFFSLVFVIMMSLYSIKLTLIVAVCVALISILYVTVTPELRRRLESRFQMAAASNSYLVESVTGIQTVKSLAIEGKMQKNWEDHLGRYVNSSFRLLNMSNAAGALATLFQKAMTISVLYLGVRLVMENKLTIGQLIAFQMFTGQFTGPILRLVSLWNEFQQAILSVDRIGDILNHPVEIQTDHAITLPELKGFAKFDNVSFRYSPTGPFVLENIKFQILPGMKVGIVGRSGSGKSTLTKLVQRLYIPNDGAIYIDNIDIRHINPIWLRHNIGVVLQENYLFSGSIRENIAMPRPDAPIEMIIQAAAMAGAHEFISQLPDGYDTFVGERGSSLSGGQKQRIAIARALITNPKVLIFDEATSALDYESESVILKNLDVIAKGRTVFIISHKLNIVKGCDLIIAMDKGKIVEMGKPDELLQRNGYYRHLHSFQV